MKVLFFATLRRLTGTKEIEIDKATDLEDLISLLGQIYGYRFAQEMIKDGQLNRDVMVMINGRAVEHLGGLKAILAENDTVAIFPRLAGG